MIRRTFLILPSVGKKRERSLWHDGINNWNDFISCSQIPGFSPKRKGMLDERLEQASVFMDKGRTDYFSMMLPTNEHWRIYGDYKEEAAYLDIETDAQPPYPKITVVGIHYKGKMTTLVRGKDLTGEAIKDVLKDCKVLVTYNGSSYDLPIIQYHYPFALPRVPHFDLRHGCRKIGLTGGLKKVERSMGINRCREIEYMTGEEAVYLWRIWERKGRENALNLLKRYNMEDTENLKPIAEHTYCTLKEMILSERDPDERRNGE